MIYELILALVLLWVLVNSIKKENPKEKTSDGLFLLFYLKIFFLLLYYYFASFWF